MDPRKKQLEQWCAQHFNLDTVALSDVSGDASFRRYFRYQTGAKAFILMDAPPEKEDSSRFVSIGQHWYRQGIPVPAILNEDLAQGFMLLEDFGDRQLFSALLSNAKPDVSKGQRLYSKAISLLHKIQDIDDDSRHPLPPYDEALFRREMALFTDWLLAEALALSLDSNVAKALQQNFDTLVNCALAQVQVPVHRDYHSRNLMLRPDNSIGLIDFQDAVSGPYTYDLVSLLRDCYVAWPQSLITELCQTYQRQTTHAKISQLTRQHFQRDFDLMGLQRHLKAAGIFARLALRDGKVGYLDDIPRTLNYIVEVSGKYPELSALHQLVTTHVLPRMTEQLGALKQRIVSAKA
jgi:hypothetical protein